MSSSGTARIIGPSSAATRCSPTKNEDSPYIRATRSSASMRSCQSMRSWVKSRSCDAPTAGAPTARRARGSSRRFASPRSADSCSAGSLVARKSTRSVRGGGVLGHGARAYRAPGWPANLRRPMRRHWPAWHLARPSARRRGVVLRPARPTDDLDAVARDPRRARRSRARWGPAGRSTPRRREDAPRGPGPRGEAALRARRRRRRRPAGWRCEENTRPDVPLDVGLDIFLTTRAARASGLGREALRLAIAHSSSAATTAVTIGPPRRANERRDPRLRGRRLSPVGRLPRLTRSAPTAPWRDDLRRTAASGSSGATWTSRPYGLSSRSRTAPRGRGARRPRRRPSSGCG